MILDLRRNDKNHIQTNVMKSFSKIKVHVKKHIEPDVRFFGEINLSYDIYQYKLRIEFSFL